jgi:uncharacterized damage-inducible protein DinB
MTELRSTELSTLLRYKAWTNRTTFATVAALPEGAANRAYATRFGSIVHTLNHVFVVEEIFRAHLEGRPHGHTSRNTSVPPLLEELRKKVEAMDLWWVDYVGSLTAAQLDEVVPFEFVDGGHGSMSRLEILLHLVIHATYHRGFVGDMLFQASVDPQPTDFTVYVRNEMPTHSEFAA